MEKGTKYSIDLSSLDENSSPEAWAVKAAELDEILKTYGFLWIENHDILEQHLDQLAETSRTFFNLPKDVKQIFQKPKGKVVFHGYNAIKDLTGDRIYREYFHYWPHAPNKYESESDRFLLPFYNSITSILPDLSGLAQKILKLLGITLNVGERFFLENHKGLQDFKVGNHSYLAAINYPPLDEGVKMAEGKQRMGQHTDWDTFSLLLMDPVGGLEAQKPGGEWMKCDPHPGFSGSGEGKFAVLMILGEFIEIWSGSRYKATPHRVPVPEDGSDQKQRARLGLPYFVLPDNPTMIQPLNFTPYAAGEYFENQIAKVIMRG